MRKRVIGVMGGAGAGEDACRLAYRLGQLVADGGDVLLCGGRAHGVMEHAARGARDRGGLTVGVLPGSDPDRASTNIDLADWLLVGADVPTPYRMDFSRSYSSISGSITGSWQESTSIYNILRLQRYFKR